LSRWPLNQKTSRKNEEKARMTASRRGPKPLGGAAPKKACMYQKKSRRGRGGQDSTAMAL